MDEIRAALESAIAELRERQTKAIDVVRNPTNVQKVRWVEQMGIMSGLDAGIKKLESILSLTYKVQNGRTDSESQG